MVILLIGLRGAGKSTVGPLVAARLGLAFVDLDALTVADLGCASVGAAWAAKGEAGFRLAEARVLAQAAGRDGTVIALGGGTPTAPGAAATIAQTKQRDGRVVYLRASAVVLRSRLAGQTGDRPSLTGADALVEIEAVLARRDPAYLELADFVVDVDRLDADETAAAVAAAVTQA